MNNSCSFANDLVPVFSFGNGLDVIILASEAVPAEVWARIIFADLRERFQKESPIDGSPSWHFPIACVFLRLALTMFIPAYFHQVLPSETETAFENFLRRATLSTYIICAFRFIGMLKN
jgi:hypothetical protein